MNKIQFIELFNDVLETKIPTVSRDRIKTYWKRFNVSPVILVTDAEIADMEKRCGKRINSAGVISAPDCRFVFAFRLSLLQGAPTTILRTIIQHELIHVDMVNTDTPEKFAEERIKQFEAQIAAAVISNPNGRSQFSRIEEQLNAARVYLIEERSVYTINREWGGDEDAARKWIEDNSGKPEPH